jgi:hypothetical protein
MCGVRHCNNRFERSAVEVDEQHADAIDVLCSPTRAVSRVHCDEDAGALIIQAHELGPAFVKRAVDNAGERSRQFTLALPLALLFVVVERLEREERRVGVEQLEIARGLRLVGGGFTFGGVFGMEIALYCTIFFLGPGVTSAGVLFSVVHGQSISREQAAHRLFALRIAPNDISSSLLIHSSPSWPRCPRRPSGAPLARRMSPSGA